MNLQIKFFMLVQSLLFCFGATNAWADTFDGYIIKLKPGAVRVNQNLNFTEFGAIKKIVKTGFGNFAHLESRAGLSQANLQALAKNPQVQYVVPNHIIKIKIHSPQGLANNFRAALTNQPEAYPFGSTLPSDEKFPRQWGLYNGRSDQEDEDINGSAADINAVRAWDLTKGSSTEPVKIAVIDSGIDYNHPDLKAQMAVNQAELNGKKGFDDDGNGYTDDIYGYDFFGNDGDPMDGGGHGTHCAGVIGASHNGIGVVGVMAHVKLVALKFLSDKGEGQEIDAIRAIDYAIKNDIKVLSNSWGGTDRLQALEDAIIAANEAGVSFVAAAGNDAENNDTVSSFPANFKADNVISVGAFNIDGNRSDFSNYGTNSVHVMAPGTDIISTYLEAGYEYLSGTSMATPHVTGVIGLLLSKWPDLTPLQIRQHLMATSYKTDTLSDSSISGGRINSYKALMAKPD
jgi:subtilisin family serine protease